MESHCILFYILLIWVIPMSYCYYDSGSLTLIKRMEALEKRDEERSIMIGRLTRQLENQETKMQVMESTINSLQSDIKMYSHELIGKDRAILKLQHNQNQLSKAITRPVKGMNVSKDATNNVADQTNKLKTNKLDHGNQNLDDTQTGEIPVLTNLAKHKNLIDKSLIKSEGNPDSSKPDRQLNNEQGLNDFTGRHWKRSNVQGPVAFHAVTDRGQVQHLGTNENIKFETMLLNSGDGYHSQHGLFIAPKACLYLFSTSVLSSNTLVQAEITKNGAALAKAYANGSVQGHSQGSVTVVTQMSVGDEVWVKHTYPTDGQLWGDRYTTFTGIWLSEM